uniref:Uncharacterized protein n=1 Tax=Aegilops tauschii subsp. strangulata TaxID=200361 RepID=A0A452ZP42_AEGTS
MDRQVCEQEVQPAVQGDHRRRLPHQGGPHRGQARHLADLGYSRAGEVPEPRRGLLQGSRLLRASLRRQCQKNLQHARHLARRVHQPGRPIRPQAIPLHFGREQGRSGRWKQTSGS